MNQRFILWLPVFLVLLLITGCVGSGEAKRRPYRYITPIKNVTPSNITPLENVTPSNITPLENVTPSNITPLKNVTPSNITPLKNVTP